MPTSLHDRPSILVIEDDAWIRSFLLDVLADEGYAALEAADGASGLRLASRHAPALILLDLAMPRLTGVQVLHELRRDGRTRDIPVIVVSAFKNLLSSSDRKEVDQVLEKPFDVGLLLEAIDTALRSDPIAVPV
jgi:CheY-like chemotaxis protein